MPRLHKGHRYSVCVTDEVTNYLVTVPIFQAISEEIGEALIENVIMKYCIPEYIIMDQDSAFMSSLMTYLFYKFDIKIKTVSPLNHQSLQAEHRNKSRSHILTKHLTSLGQMWTKYLSLATFAYKTFNNLNLGYYSPYELTFGRKPKLLLNVESNTDIKVSRNFKEYYELLNKRIKYLQDILFNVKLQRLFAGKHNHSVFRILYAHSLGIQHYSINSLLYLRLIQDKYIALYKELITQLCTHVPAIRVLAKGYLPNSLIKPAKLQEILNRSEENITIF